ncbi:hypothetical protein [Alteromonas pelagimontana]|uniref:hypothetical protein n=1 Tax=Alteromonas pelagimontana TaxID=1858656 RepID=UPI000A787B53|nr:hypothetical protein [Alteromonas pelagimontana]
MAADPMCFALAISTCTSLLTRSHGAFFEEKYLLNNVEKIAHLPIDIVQGQYDTICPTRSAWLVKKKLDKAILHISKMASHDAREPP